jgi:hypothetical protein
MLQGLTMNYMLVLLQCRFNCRFSVNIVGFNYRFTVDIAVFNYELSVNFNVTEIDWKFSNFAWID